MDGGGEKKPAFKVNFGGGRKSAHAKARQQQQQQQQQHQKKREGLESTHSSSGGSPVKGGKGPNRGKGKGSGGKGKGKGKGVVMTKAFTVAGQAMEEGERIRPSKKQSKNAPLSASSSSSSASAASSATPSLVKMEEDDDGKVLSTSAPSAQETGNALNEGAVEVAKEEEDEDDLDSDFESDEEEDVWAPVSVPYYKASKDPKPPSWRAANPSPAEVAQEESDLFFLQLPTVLPPVAWERLRTDRPGGLTSVPAVGRGQDQQPAQGGSGGAPAGPSASAVPNLQAGTGSHTQGALGEVSSGFFGTIKVHASGRRVLHLGASQYELTPGTHCSFAQQAVVVRPGEKPISDAGQRAKDEARYAAEVAAAAAFTSSFEAVEVDPDTDEASAGAGGEMGQAQSAQAAAAASAVATVRAAAERQDSAMPRAYTVLGSVTRRLVAVPALPAEDAQRDDDDSWRTSSEAPASNADAMND